jgi:acyl-CoA synthetase (AMP-forming)/AMP-acid ligase II
MIEIDDHSTLGTVLFEAAKRYGANALMAVPANAGRAYHPQGYEISFEEAGVQVRSLMDLYDGAGYGVGHRVGLLLESRPEHMLHKLALNALGACCVPINPDYRSRELAYLIDHSRVDLVVVLAARRELLDSALAEASNRPAIAVFEHFARPLTSPARAADREPVTSDTPASILYTSGTTGRPKGCVLSHRYELAAGAAYATCGGMAEIREARERIYNPLPLFHVNASILSFFCVLLTGNCQVQTDRFQPSRFWAEVRESRATVVHYLGVVIPMLLNQPAGPQDREHGVRFGFGAGVEPQLHGVFEERFGFPLLELWGMTEMVRMLVDNMQPRQVGTRAFGRAVPGVEVRVVDEADRDQPDGTPGEMVIRHSEATPRKDFFTCYLDDPVATEEAWHGGWFHTGDVVVRDATGMLHFVDRRKNIIRRSGENIAAAEVEALLQSHPLVAQVAVLAVPDEVREEEVLACVVLKLPVEGDDARVEVTHALFDFCHRNLAYYKAPGYVWIADSIPTTGTHKIQKHAILPKDGDPRRLPGMVDLRHLKKRGPPRAA